jgi:DMSO/TMAO reductase YedYZ molybdopterin-dependent catalytic subunit
VVGRRAIALGLLLVTAVAIGGVLLARSTRERSTNLKNLAAVEIKEYQGTDLSSITDFRENSIKGPQHIDLESYRLKVDGLVENPLEYTLEEATDIHRSYQKVVTLNCIEGWRVEILWEGVLVNDLIAEAKASPEANTVIFHAYDGYTTSLPLDYIAGQNIMLAYKMNGVVLPPERGAPFQLVAESKWGYKWIKWVTEIDLSDDINYKGYWEKRGYSNDADL